MNVETTEDLILTGVQWLRLAVETMGALMVALGCALALYHFVRTLIREQNQSFNPIRLILARYLALALEFQLGADILSTAIAWAAPPLRGIRSVSWPPLPCFAPG